MRAFRLNGPGNSLKLVEEPDPAAVAGQVLVDIKAATLNYRDLIVREGRYASAQKPDLIPLSDGAGVITAVGEGVSRDRIGQRVAIAFMPGWLEGSFSTYKQSSALGGGFVDGVLAERVVVPSGAALQFPDDWSFEEAAAYPCAGVTAWRSLFGGAGIGAGGTVLVQGTGGVSMFALQFARAVGARVIATSSSDEKLQAARRLGAEIGINYKKHENWGELAAQAAGEAGIDLVVEVGGSGTLNQALRAVRPGGEIALVGVLTGFGGDVNTGSILMNAVNVRGVYVGSAEDLRQSLRSRVKPIIHEVIPFARADDAFSLMRSGRHIGKIAVRMDG